MLVSAKHYACGSPSRESMMTMARVFIGVVLLVSGVERNSPKYDTG